VGSVPDPSRVRVAGPLAPFAPGLVQELASLGYRPASAAMQMTLTAQLSRWLLAEGVGLNRLTGPMIDRFLAERRARGVSYRCSPRALAPMLGYLRRLGAVPPPAPTPAPTTAADVLLARFAVYLAEQRALSTATVGAYVHRVRPFVEEVACPGGVDRVGLISAGEVTAFLTARLPLMTPGKAVMTASALRSLLRFLHAEVMTETALAGAVPAVASHRLAGLPEPLTAVQVRSLLAACDDSTGVGRRDLAVMLLMCRLGLRCAEVAALRLDDLDWTGGTVTVHGKSGRIDRMPLPTDVGHVLVAYLCEGRPDSQARTVFVRAVAPFTPLLPTSVSRIVVRAAQRAGLGTVHGHRLRHTAATETVNAGASLEEVAQLLRHDGVATTVIYAKTDLNRLARLARPWPTGTAAQ